MLCGDKMSSLTCYCSTNVLFYKSHTPWHFKRPVAGSKPQIRRWPGPVCRFQMGHFSQPHITVRCIFSSAELQVSRLGIHPFSSLTTWSLRSSSCNLHLLITTAIGVLPDFNLVVPACSQAVTLTAVRTAIEVEAGTSAQVHRSLWQVVSIADDSWSCYCSHVSPFDLWPEVELDKWNIFIYSVFFLFLSEITFQRNRQVLKARLSSMVLTELCACLFV